MKVIYNGMVMDDSVAKTMEQTRRAMQFASVGFTDEQAMEVATIYDPWKVGKAYAVGEFVTYGKNSVGDPQLYKVVQAHTSQADWTPGVATSLFVPIGLDDSGIPIWSQPTGAHDAYNIGDIVVHNGVKYISVIGGNVWEPNTSQNDYWDVF